MDLWTLSCSQTQGKGIQQSESPEDAFQVTMFTAEDQV